MANRELIISDPLLWAQANRYSLYAISTGYAVGFQGQVVGKLNPVHTGGFKFTHGGEQPAGIKAVPGSLEEEIAQSSQSSANPLDPFFSKSFFMANDLKPIELHTIAKKGDNDIYIGADRSGTGSAEHISECNTWLPYAAGPYQLSNDIRDYILIPAPAIFSDLPNTNGDSLSLKEMTRFDPTMGMQMYKTFRGKPCHQEHDNKDITRAKGVILDSFLRPITTMGNGKYWKMIHLYAFDRTKDPILAQAILNGDSNAYSIGFYYTSYTCSICGTRVGKGINATPCAHTFMGKPTYKLPNGRLVYRKCENGVGFESSAVSNPAFVCNLSDIVYDPRKL